jgi:ubiquinol-cytochrome c reductase cytochrome b subunit
LCHKNKFQGNQFYPINKILYWIIIITIVLLTWVGARPVEIPYIFTGQLLTVIKTIVIIIIQYKILLIG